MRAFNKQFIPKPNVNVPSILQKAHLKKELEIGSGNGEFAIKRAISDPKSHFIAIEKTKTLFHKMWKKYQQNPLPNLWPFHTNAIWWITHFTTENSFNKIYILYPNVYIKSRQSNLRWFNRPFMPYLINRLKTEGQLEIRTNNKTYYEECKLKMRVHNSIKKTKDIFIKNDPCTAFERKYIKQGHTCYCLIYTRIHNPQTTN